MALVFKCDLCKGIFETECKNRDLSIYITRGNVERGTDLCDACYLNLKALFSGDATINRIRKENG